VATFNGVDLGMVEGWSTSPAPKDRQVTAYPGVDGLEITDLGARGGTSTFRVVLMAEDPPALAALKGTLVGLQQDGGAYDLVDDEGTTWTSVILAAVRPVPGRRLLYGWPAGDVPGVAQRVELEFLHTGD
jgi:hypothetical protein